MPTATVFAVAFPDWNVTSPVAIQQAPAPPAPAPAVTSGAIFLQAAAPAPSVGTSTALGASNGTTITKPSGPSEFTGGASKNSAIYSVLFAAGVLALMI